MCAERINSSDFSKFNISLYQKNNCRNTVLLISKNPIFSKEFIHKSVQNHLNTKELDTVDNFPADLQSSLYFIAIEFDMDQAQAILNFTHKIKNIPIILISSTHRIQKWVEWNVKGRSNVLVLERLPSSTLLFNQSLNFANEYFCLTKNSEEPEHTRIFA